MKCEICHKQEAQVAVTRKIDGVEKELYVCKACAETNPPPGKKRQSDHHGHNHHPQVTLINGKDAHLPEPLVQGIVEATLDFMKGVAEIEENEHRVCPVCKSNWDKIKESGRITCPACWKTFAKKIRSEFLAMEFGPRHVGSAPSVDKLPDASSMRKVLERDLKNAIAREDYRRAAEIKRKLDEFDPNDNPKDAQ